MPSFINVQTNVRKCCSKECAVRQVKRRIPVLTWLPTISVSSVLYDLAGGITVGVTAITQGLAYALLAGMPVEYGLYTAIVSGFTYFVMGTSRDINMGPTAINSLLTGGIVKETAAPIHRLLCFFAGLVMLLFSFLRLEVLLNIFPVTVTSGFTSAAAILIVSSQLKHLFGIAPLPRKFTELIPAFFKKVGQTDFWDLISGSLVLVFLLGIQYAVPPIVSALSKRKQTRIVKIVSSGLSAFSILRALLALVISAGTAFAISQASGCATQVLPDGEWAIQCPGELALSCQAFSNASGCSSVNYDPTAAMGLTLTGPVPRGLPKFDVPPFFGYEMEIDHSTEMADVTIQNTTINPPSNQTAEAEFINFSTLMGYINVGIIVIPIISVIELLAIGRALAQRGGYTVDASQEMFACGTAHVIGAFLNAYPSSGSFTRSALNSQCKVKTQMCSFFTALLVLLAAATIADVTLPYVPKSCLAAVVIAAALSMIEWHMIGMLWQVNRVDILPTAITFFACLILDIEYGILIGVIAALVLSAILSMRSIRSKISIKEEVVLEGDKPCLVVTMPSGEIRYPSADSIKKLWSQTGDYIGCVVVDCSQVREIDFATIIAILQLSKNPIKKGTFSSSYPFVFVGLEQPLMIKFQDAVSVLNLKPPTHRTVHYASNFTGVGRILQQRPSKISIILGGKNYATSGSNCNSSSNNSDSDEDDDEQSEAGEDVALRNVHSSLDVEMYDISMDDVAGPKKRKTSTVIEEDTENTGGRYV